MEKKYENISFNDVLISCKKYLTNEETLAFIEKAYKFAAVCHEGQFRKTGEPYINHLLNVAYILAELQVGPYTIIAGFLHDTIEDCGLTKERIAQEFNNEIATLVESVTKVTQLSAMTQEEFQAENHRKIFIAMAKDIRVILIKLADRLHNMRTLYGQPAEKQKRIAKETLEVYSPIAHRLGINTIKSELEDLSLKYLEPEKYHNISLLLKRKESERNLFLKIMSGKIESLLKEHEIPFRMSGRVKNIYSIYKKMYVKNRIFEEIYDLQALRIITDTETRCYEILGYIHAMYRPIPGRFKDYIAMPKPNMYQSLHTTIIADDGGIFEIQIRTEKMDQIAEGGVAAHWRYKENIEYDAAKVQKEIEEKLAWFRELVTFSNNESDDAQNYMESLQKDIFEANVYILTPKGRVIDLPNGSTPLDFAYKIHTQVGHSTVGAVVNGVLVPLNTVLKTGDICDIKTSKSNSVPSEGWLKIVKTNSAKNAIKKALIKHNSTEKREEIIESSKKNIEEMLRNEKLDVKNTLKSFEDKKFLSSHNVDTIEQFLIAVYNKSINIKAIIENLKAEEVRVKKEKEKENEFLQRSRKKVLDHNASKIGVIVPGVDSIAISFSQCCSPIPGDSIKGYVSKGQGVKIHRSDCPNIKNETQRLIDVEWDYDFISNDTSKHYVDIQISAKDRQMLLVDVMNYLSSIKVPVTSVKASSHDATGTALINLCIQVKDANELNEIMNSIKSSISDIYEIIRYTKN